MIIKTFKMPKRLLSLKALEGRLSEEHPKKEFIGTILAKSTAGYKGEKSLEYYLSYLPEKKYYIFHNVRLPVGKHHFQMDILLLSNYFILIIEVKNISGILFFDSDFKQVIRTQDNTKEKFPDSVTQAEGDRMHLMKWLKQNKFPEIPIETLVVICNPRTILQTTPNNQIVFNKVLHSTNLLSKIVELEQSYKSELIKTSRLNNHSNQILHKSIEKESDILQSYSVLPAEVLKGVHCPTCTFLPMIWKTGKWHCTKCDNISQTAHLNSLQDYSLLISPTITNRQAREILISKVCSYYQKRFNENES